MEGREFNTFFHFWCCIYRPKIEVYKECYMVPESQINWTNKIWYFQNTLSSEERNVENAQNVGFTLLGLSFEIGP